MNNISENIKEKLNNNLHNKQNHPINNIKELIYNYFGAQFSRFDNLSPYVSTENNFDLLLIPKDHPARSYSDTYYLDENTVLRTHTSAHQNELIQKGERQFLVTGDVYRKDDIDKTHYPIFHQMEGVYITENNIDIESDLKKHLSGLVETLFPNCEYRYNSDYFPFTDPSWEVEVFYEGKWLEILGCGIIHKDILKNNNLEHSSGWAFGLGLERLAMILYKIPDIRYFWTEDERFHKQFKSDQINEFKEYSKFPPTERDVAFWISDVFTHNDFCEIVRNIGQDLVENLSLIDEFNKKERTSKCYRITYRSNDRTLTNDEINIIQEKIRTELENKLKVELR